MQTSDIGNDMMFSIQHREERCTISSLSLYIYIYIVINWAKFGHFKCYYLGQVGIIIWAKLFSTYKNRGFKRFLVHLVIILWLFVPNYLAVIKK